jgi:thiol-disulfide isomerase/thioredoxin
MKKLLLLSLSLITINSFAQDNQKILDAIKNESTVIVAFHSKSCSSCKIQKPELENILEEEAFKSSKNFFLDFDTNIQLKKQFNVQYPSTVIVFKNGNEISRVTGETNKGKLTKLIKQGF